MIEYFLNTMEPLRQRNKRRIDHTKRYTKSIRLLAFKYLTEFF